MPKRILTLSTFCCFPHLQHFIASQPTMTLAGQARHVNGQWVPCRTAQPPCRLTHCCQAPSANLMLASELPRWSPGRRGNRSFIPTSLFMLPCTPCLVSTYLGRQYSALNAWFGKEARQARSTPQPFHVTCHASRQMDMHAINSSIPPSSALLCLSVTQWTSEFGPSLSNDAHNVPCSLLGIPTTNEPR
jgi:hypothetical protein